MALKHTARWLTAKITGANWNDTDHEVDADGMTLAGSSATPVSAAAGKIKLWARSVAGRLMPAFVDEVGTPVTLQPHVGRNKIAAWIPVGSGNNLITVIGGAAISGTVTARGMNANSYFESVRRAGYVGAATAGSTINPRAASFIGCRGNAENVGGFHVIMRFGCSDAATVAGARSFAGLRDSTSAIGNINPSTLQNIIGVGSDGGETTLSIMHNDGAGTATKIPLGDDFPDHTLSVDMYELVLYCPPNASYVGYQVRRLNTGHMAEGTITTDLPSPTTFLAWTLFRNNGPTALACAVDFSSIYTETDS